MTLYPSLPSRNPSHPSDRYLKTDPLRREFGLKLLTETLPEPLRTSLIRAWRRPGRYDGKQALQSLYRQRPDDAQLFSMPPRLLGVMTLTELEVARRGVDAAHQHQPRPAQPLLKAQGVYLRALYTALVTHLGEATALAEFLRLVTSVG